MGGCVTACLSLSKPLGTPARGRPPMKRRLEKRRDRWLGGLIVVGLMLGIAVASYGLFLLLKGEI
ncbi:hypothetical protein GCM10008949_04080 [Deinococcus humi]|nr:hypothetical protein GCM10008949_04080 [Deinococcus humi]